MKKFKTYLAGAFCPYKFEKKEYPDWRDFVIEKLNNKRIQLYDPRFKSDQLCPATFTIDDAKGVLNSNILLHFRTRGYEDEGASWEHGIAFGVNLYNQKLKKLPNFLIDKSLIFPSKLVIYADETNVPFPLHFASANLTFNSLETSVKFLNSLKSLRKRDFMPFYMKLMDKERAG